MCHCSYSVSVQNQTSHIITPTFPQMLTPSSQPTRRSVMLPVCLYGFSGRQSQFLSHRGFWTRLTISFRRPRWSPCCPRSSTDSPPSPAPLWTCCPSSRLRTPSGSCGASAASRSCSLRASSSSSLRGRSSSAGCAAAPPPGPDCSCTKRSPRPRRLGWRWSRNGWSRRRGTSHQPGRRWRVPAGCPSASLSGPRWIPVWPDAAGFGRVQTGSWWRSPPCCRFGAAGANSSEQEVEVWWSRWRRVVPQAQVRRPPPYRGSAPEWTAPKLPPPERTGRVYWSALWRQTVWRTRQSRIHREGRTRGERRSRLARRRTWCPERRSASAGRCPPLRQGAAGRSEPESADAPQGRRPERRAGWGAPAGSGRDPQGSPDRLEAPGRPAERGPHCWAPDGGGTSV